MSVFSLRRICELLAWVVVAAVVAAAVVGAASLVQDNRPCVRVAGSIKYYTIYYSTIVAF